MHDLLATIRLRGHMGKGSKMASFLVRVQFDHLFLPLQGPAYQNNQHALLASSSRSPKHAVKTSCDIHRYDGKRRGPAYDFAAFTPQVSVYQPTAPAEAA